MNKLIRCINCQALFFKTSFDQGEEYELSSSTALNTFHVTYRDDFQEFLKNHRGHQLEDLRILEDSFISEKPYFEPIKVSYFRATNGRENFVIKKFREKIDEPLKYQLITGDYSLKCVNIEIQSEEITKQLATEFKTAPLSQVQINAFLKLFQRIAETVDINNLERISEESSHPLEIYYKMDDLSLIYMLRNCRRIFKGQQYSDIEAFIHRHKEDGVLLLKGTYRIEVTEKTQAARKAVAAQIRMKTKKIAEKT
jgi:hypothetical protein